MTGRAFLIRDWRLAISHRVPFVLEAVGVTFALLEVSFIGQIIEPDRVPGGYFSFVVTGLVLTGLLAAGIVTMAGSVRQEQVQGTLEVLVSTGLGLGRLIGGLAAYPYVAAIVRSAFLLALAAILGAGAATDANWPLAFTGLALASISFVALGAIASAVVVSFRQAAGVAGWLLTMLVFAAGVGFPIDLLPPWLQSLSELSPLTQGLKVVRGAVLEGSSWGSQAGALLALVVSGAALGLAGWGATRWAVARALRRGTLAQY